LVGGGVAASFVFDDLQTVCDNCLIRTVTNKNVSHHGGTKHKMDWEEVDLRRTMKGRLNEKCVNGVQLFNSTKVTSVG
jgi:hypothetical protein